MRNMSEESKEMFSKAGNELIWKLGIRKNAVTMLLKEELLEEAESGSIRNISLQLDTNGQLSSNSVLNSLRSSAEPLLKQFSEDLVAIITEVTLILPNIRNNDDEEESMLMDFVTVLDDMNLWTSEMMSTLIEYHLTRTKMKEGIDLEKLMADSTFQETDDMCQALILGDCKMAKEIKNMLNTLLFNYITLEGMVPEVLEEHHNERRSHNYKYKTGCFKTKDMFRQMWWFGFIMLAILVIGISIANFN